MTFSATCSDLSGTFAASLRGTDGRAGTDLLPLLLLTGP